MMRKLLQLSVVLGIIALAGCQVKEAEVYQANDWEGHYYSAEEAQKAAAKIKLNHKQSVWIISNDTLNRTLKNVAERTQYNHD